MEFSGSLNKVGFQSVGIFLPQILKINYQIGFLFAGVLLAGSGFQVQSLKI